MTINKFLSEHVKFLEDAGEILPGSGKLITSQLPPTSSISEAVTQLHSHIYGTRSFEYEGELMPAREPSPFLSKSAPSLKKDPIRAALFRLSHVLKGSTTIEDIARERVEFVAQSDAPQIAGRLLHDLFKSRDERVFNVYRPERPPAELRVQALLEELQSDGIIGNHVDMSDLANQWKSIGHSPRHEQLRIIKSRLSDPTRFDLSPNGQPVRWNTNDHVGEPDPAVEEATAELMRDGSYG